MRFSVSSCAEGLARTVAKISEEIEPELHLVSQAARDEWAILQSRWRPMGGREEKDKVEPSVSPELGRDFSQDFSEEEIEALEVKVRRFRDIVRALAPRVTREPIAPSTDGGAPRGDSPGAGGV